MTNGLSVQRAPLWWENALLFLGRTVGSFTSVVQWRPFSLFVVKNGLPQKGLAPFFSDNKACQFSPIWRSSAFADRILVNISLPEFMDFLGLDHFGGK